MNEKKLYNKTPHKTACAFILLFSVMLIGATLAVNYIPGSGALHQNLMTTLSSSIPLILTIIIYVLKYKPDKKRTFRLEPIGIKSAIYFVILGVCAWGFSGMLNMPVIVATSFLGELPESAVPEMISAVDYISSVFSVALMPAIFEELFCRGIVMRLYEKYSKTAAVIISALLFSIMHNNFLNIPSTFFMGIVMAVCVLKTGSIIPAMIIHFTSNFSSTTIAYMTSLFEGRSDIITLQAFLLAVSSALFIFVFIPMIKKPVHTYETDEPSPPAVIDIDLSDMEKPHEAETLIIEIDDDMPRKIKYGFSVSLCFIILIFIVMQILLVQTITGA